MNSFAYLTSPRNITQIKHYWPITKIIPEFLIKAFFKKESPIKIGPIRISQEQEIEGYIIVSPLLLDKTSIPNSNVAMKKIIASTELAQQLGARIIGVDSNISFASEALYGIAKRIKLPLTFGNTFTAWSIFEAIYRTSKVKNIDLKKSAISIIGRFDATMSLCVRKFSELSSKIIIHNPTINNGQEDIKKTVSTLSPTDIFIDQDIDNVIKNAEIIIINKGINKDNLALDEVKKNCIVCDVSQSDTLFCVPGARSDVSVIKGGIIKLPAALNVAAEWELPKNMVYTPMAETMLLALEDKFTHYSFGENINLDKLEEIADIAAKHRFEVWVPEAPVI